MSANKNAAPEAVKAELCPNDDRHMLALQCTLDISGIAEAISALADEAAQEGSVKIEALARCYGMRITTLNDSVLGYLNKDPITAEEMRQKIFGKTKEFKGCAA